MSRSILSAIPPGPFCRRSYSATCPPIILLTSSSRPKEELQKLATVINEEHRYPAEKPGAAKIASQLPKGYVTRKSTPPFRSFVRAAERTTVMDEVRSVDASREASATSREASR